ncbi:MAG: GntR family transcriptional regulator [Olegusella sp.]|nr:GntR family transcriptional regulator [Olegusella sp.]
MIQISYKDPRPIHEQVEDGVRRLIISGALPPGDQLPSVRELATTLAINPNTIARAYHDLETQGYVYKVPGKGSFVSDELPVDTHRRDELLQTLDQTVAELLYLGANSTELKARIDAAHARQEGGAK